MNHPNLSDEINRNIAQSEVEGGVFLDKLAPGAVLHVRTKNTSYTIEKKEADGRIFYLISGHPKYCPTPSITSIHGSTWGGSMLKVGFIGRGMRMEFTDPRYSAPRGIITTSKIQEVTEVL